VARSSRQSRVGPPFRHHGDGRDFSWTLIPAAKQSKASDSGTTRTIGDFPRYGHYRDSPRHFSPQYAGVASHWFATPRRFRFCATALFQWKK
jgi:hypothetical protein